MEKNQNMGQKEKFTFLNYRKQKCTEKKDYCIAVQLELDIFIFAIAHVGFGTLYSFVSLCGHGQKSLENVVWLLLWCGSSSQCTLMRLLPSHSLYSVPKWENFDLAFDTLGSPLRCLHYYCCFTISILGGFCIGEKSYWSDCKIPVIHARLIWKSLRENDLSFFWDSVVERRNSIT